MHRFGAHVSIAGGVDRAVERGRELGCECIQIFVKSPRQWRFQPLDDAEVSRFREAARRFDIRPLYGHASYLVNLATSDSGLAERSRLCLLEEWDRAGRLGLEGLVLHPGSGGDDRRARALGRLAKALDWLHARRPDQGTRLLLETTAAAGGALGRVDELGRILDRMRHGDRIGMAIDTCHLFAAGLDLRTAEAVEASLAQMDEAFGLARIALVHANDSRGELGSRRDRHEHIGRGRIGRAGFRALLAHPSLAHLPFVLETPKQDSDGRQMDRVNLAALRRLARRASGAARSTTPSRRLSRGPARSRPLR